MMTSVYDIPEGHYTVDGSPFSGIKIALNNENELEETLLTLMSAGVSMDRIIVFYRVEDKALVPEICFRSLKKNWRKK